MQAEAMFKELNSAYDILKDPQNVPLMTAMDTQPLTNSAVVVAVDLAAVLPARIFLKIYFGI